MATRKQSTRRSKKESPDATELLALELQEIHSAESQLARVLPRLIKAANSEELGKMLEQRLTQGERIIAEVEASLEELDMTPGRKKNVAAEGLVNDAREHVQEIERGPALDTVLIGALQKTEHYCIAAWGTTRALAEAVGHKSAVKSMERALKEGKTVDEQFTQLAEQEVTPALLAQASDDDGRGEPPPGSRSGSGASERRAN
ncbi:ferritin-like domain-containing protein [Povalibacter sp.]|uniref:YciE/YciF ferroxidase family protein n=1 Tax=Povalibacter sp. TaxID=1962978 RepID=UPI002F407EC1